MSLSALVLRRAAALVALVAGVALCGRPAAAQSCVADCNADRQVGVNELITCVNLGSGMFAPAVCDACDANDDRQVSINELIIGVNNALAGCPAVGLPDLVPVSVKLRSMTPACITDSSQIQLALEVCVANRGTEASGPFLVQLLGEDVRRVDGLAAAEQICFQAPLVTFDVDVLVDAEHAVAEADEANNFRAFFVAQRTPPPFCTATPTVTETVPPIDTATATETPTPTPTTDTPPA